MSRESDISAALSSTRFNFLMKQSPFGITISPLACLGTCIGLSGEVETSKLVFWNAVMVALAVLRYLVWRATPKTEDAASKRIWAGLLGFTMVMVAIWWGFGALLILPESLAGRVFVFSVLLMMTIGTTSLYSIYPTGTTVSVLVITVPICVKFACSDEFMLKTMGIASVLYVAGAIRGIQMLSHFFVRSHELTYDLEQNVKLLERSENMRRDLSLMLIHNLRTPLSGLITRAHMAREYCSDGDLDESAQQVERVLQISHSMAEMVNSILDVNRLEDAQLPLQLSEIYADELVYSAADGTGVPDERVEVLGPEEILLSCDAELIRRVLVNLIGNAMRFQPDEEPLRIAVSRLGDAVEFRVIDKGPGIPRAHHEEIFDKYATREKRSSATSGLGLTFCKLVVEAHGGKVGVDSEVGQGSEFWFRLPLDGKIERQG